VVLAVGRLRPPFADDVQHYSKLLARHARLELVEVREDEHVGRRIPDRAFVSLLDIGGQSGRTGPLTVPLPDRPISFTFFVRQASAGQPTTQRLVVADDCSEWSTFVGGGLNAW